MSPAPISTPDEREALKTRQLPHMTLSDGSSTSLTGPPVPLPDNTKATARASLRFQVQGNAIVTGGAGTLGFEAAKALLEHGLSGLMIFDVSLSQAQPKIDELTSEFPNANISAKQVDITDSSALETAVEETALLLGSVDILLCFAGVVGCTHAMKMTAVQWRKTLDINTTGTFFCAQAAAKQMVKQGTGGSIMFVASISGHRVNYPQPQAAYNVSKAALLALKNSLAAEWARYGIRVNSISPGYMDTILNEGDGLVDARATWADRNPMGRMGVPGELTGAVILLSSSAGSYMSGTDILVDGGQVVF